jgi:hypothetical protein
MVQVVGIELELRLTLENNMVLVHLGIHRANLALTEGVIQGVIDRCWGDAKSRRCDPVDHERDGKPSSLLIGCDIF